MLHPGITNKSDDSLIVPRHIFDRLSISARQFPKMLKVTLLLTLALFTLGLARHIRIHHHPHGARDAIMYDDAQMLEIDGMSLETLRNIRPNHFVPINNALFFKRYEPCEEGLKRDLFGICREVWD